jgi:hypothetical protein
MRLHSKIGPREVLLGFYLDYNRRRARIIELLRRGKERGREVSQFCSKNQKDWQFY